MLQSSIRLLLYLAAVISLSQSFLCYVQKYGWSFACSFATAFLIFTKFITKIHNIVVTIILYKTILLRDRARAPCLQKFSKMFVQFFVQNVVHFLSQILSNIFVQIYWGGGTPRGAPRWGGTPRAPPQLGGTLAPPSWGYPRGPPLKWKSWLILLKTQSLLLPKQTIVQHRGPPLGGYP